MKSSNLPRQESHPTTELPSNEQTQHLASELGGLGEQASTQSPSFNSEPANTDRNTLLSKKELNNLRRQERKVRSEQAERSELDDTDEGKCRITTITCPSSGS